MKAITVQVLMTVIQITASILEVARERFAALREQHTKTLATIAKHGRSGKRAKRSNCFTRRYF